MVAENNIQLINNEIQVTVDINFCRSIATDPVFNQFAKKIIILEFWLERSEKKRFDIITDYSEICMPTCYN